LADTVSQTLQRLWFKNFSGLMGVPSDLPDGDAPELLCLFALLSPWQCHFFHILSFFLKDTIGKSKNLSDVVGENWKIQDFCSFWEKGRIFRINSEIYYISLIHFPF
jgi:hypothetical protein